jgi:ferrous iron transport protein A
MAEGKDREQTTVRLADLRPGQKARIQEHELNAVGLMLMEMGCIPGAVVEVEMIAPLGDPLAVRVAGYRLGIRRADALNILVVPE